MLIEKHDRQSTNKSKLLLGSRGKFEDTEQGEETLGQTSEEETN